MTESLEVMENEFKAVQHDDGLAATRKSLISRLKNWDDHESWNAFFNVYWGLIYSAAIQAGLNEEEAEEVVQETIISVSKAMPSFRYDASKGSFKAWLLQLSYWRIKDHLRRRLADPLMHMMPVASDGPGDVADPVRPELERLWDDEWEGNLLRAAIERVRQRIDPKHFQIFELATIEGWPSEKIRSVLNIGRARLYVTKHRVAMEIRREFRELQEEIC